MVEDRVVDMNKLAPWIISMVVLALITSPLLANASTLNVYVEPSLSQAKLVATTTSDLLFTYPSSSRVSNLLNGFTYSVQLSANNVPSDSQAFHQFEAELRAAYYNITLENMSVSYQLYSSANQTTLNVTKIVTITAWATGIFNKTKSHVEANFAWKNFQVKGPWQLNFNGRYVDVNTVGQGMLYPIGQQSVLPSLLLTFFTSQAILSTSTINFSQLNTPLSEWSRTYNAATNTTTFSKSVSGNFLLNASVAVNGEQYALKVYQDPSSTITVSGYAIAQGNTLVIESAPILSGPDLAGIIAVAIVIIVVITVVLLRRRVKQTVYN